MFVAALTLDDGVKLGAIVSAFVGAYVASAGVRLQRRRREERVEPDAPRFDAVEDWRELVGDSRRAMEDWRELVDDSRRERDRARRERDAAQIEADDWRRRALDCESRERRSQ